MKQTSLKKIKKLLLQQKDEILNKSNQDLSVDISGDETDAIQGAIIAHTNSQIASRDFQKLRAINEALQRIDKKDSDYGICDCGEDIGEKRLLFNPSFRTCIVCAEKNEIKARGMRK